MVIAAFGRTDAFAQFVLLRQRRNRQLPFGGGLHEAIDLGIVHRLC